MTKQNYHQEEDVVSSTMSEGVFSVSLQWIHIEEAVASLLRHNQSYRQLHMICTFRNLVSSHHTRCHQCHTLNWCGQGGRDIPLFFVICSFDNHTARVGDSDF